MKYLVLIMVVVFLHSCEESHFEEIKLEEEEVAPFMNPEVPPSFPGGITAMSEFIAENLKRPVGSLGCVEGRVFIQFTVEVDGSVTDVEVIRGIHESFDEEAIRLVKLFPQFEPGSFNGVLVPMRMIFSISFKL